MKHTELNNGVKMPMIGYGVYQIEDKKICERAVLDAIEVGYRHFDTASAYMNEEAVGAAIKKSSVKREEFFVATKIWVQDHGEEPTLKAFDKSIKKLGLEYIDLYLIHKPFGDYYGTWRAMEKLYKEGRIKAIGVTSFSSERLQDLFLHNEIKPQLNQIETNVWWQRKDEELFLKKENILQEAWAPFAEGNNDVFNNIIIDDIAKKYEKTPAQVMLRWLNQRGISVIPKTVSKQRMQENINIFDFKLSDDDLTKISTLDTRKSTILDTDNLETTKFISIVKFDI